MTKSTNLTDASLTALATYRVTKFILDDELIREPREKFQSKFPPESTKLGYLSTCPWCVSIWVAPLVHFAPTSVKAALAASAVTGIISERV